MKFCKDCRHYKRGFLFDDIKYCLKSKTEEIDPVSGKKSSYYLSCSWQRIRNCGPEAKLFEPKNPGFLKTLIDKIKRIK